MASLKYEIQLLDRNTRFALWQIKMQAILAQIDLEDALLGINNMPSTLIDEEKKRKDQKDVMKEKTVAALWKRLEQICMSKNLTSKLHVKQRLYAHRLEEGASVHEHLTVFKEILSNLEAMKVQYDKEDLRLILLCSLPRLIQPLEKQFYIAASLSQLIRERVLLLVGDKIRMLIMIVEGHRNGILANKIKREAANQKGKQPENSGEADVVEDYSDGELLIASVNDSKVSEEWILDSGCTFHMSPNQDWFTTYKTVSEGVLLMGNNASCKITGVGTIKVKMFDGVVKTLIDVRHVPELNRNLISLSTLDSKGYRYTAESGFFKISKGFLFVMKGQRKTAKLYVLQGSTVTGDAAVASSSLSDDDITKLWHMRLGHMSENGMQKRVRFTRGIHNTKGTLKYIHSDLWGPSKVPSRGGANYMLTFIDDISRKVWAFFLKQKSNVFSAFKSWKIMIEKQTGKQIKYLRTDNGLEFCSAEFNRLCKSERIMRHLTVRHTLKQNGVAEQMNRMIMEKTPQEIWSGNPANYSNLKIFRCLAYANVDNGKLEPRSIKCVVLGYKAGVKGYNLWCPENRKVVISRDIVFDETAMLPNLSLKDSSNKENQKTRREIKPPKKYTEADLVAYALNVAEDIDANQEPSNYSEAISYEDSEKWMFAIQITGVDFTDVFFPVVKYSSIRALLGIMAMHDLELE
ncbi:hypothetical protein CXB51_016964 [Gossypium anomalum]|uniref:Integrase catalytic domain-containing protein n=1 Tax=Gossypium anomalum TaxID=47600 RepID=A0A8J6CY79_9ROSI|nr:hypothetical protein CXB51_016964 [Gossypium anomalum]